MTGIHPGLTTHEAVALQRLVRGILVSEHPMVRRAVADALHSSTREEAAHGADRLAAALLAAEIPA